MTRVAVLILAACSRLAAADDLDVPATPPSSEPAPPQPEPTPPQPEPTPAQPEPAPAPAPSPVVATSAVENPPAPSLASAAVNAGIDISAYVQAQGQLDGESQDQLQQGGAQLNQDNFVVRRARIALAKRWRTAALAIELDANTVRGAAVGLRRAEATLILPGETEDLPVAALTVGLTDIPFGFELAESSRARLFMERSTASLAFFPNEPDVGARVWGGYGPFRYAVALLAGEPANRADPNRAKDLVARVGVDTAPHRAVHISSGVSLVLGRGFHAGTDATKDTIDWRDLNENGAIELGELTSVPGVAATPSENFDRWAVNADVELAVRTAIGATQLRAEITVASNLDRGLFVSDPIATGIDTRQLGAYVALLQDIGEHAFVGVRGDYYDPNLDALDPRGGMLIPVDETIVTISPLLGVRLPHHVRAALQYDVVIDSLTRDTRGVPTDLSNNRLTARLQVEL